VFVARLVRVLHGIRAVGGGIKGATSLWTD